MQEDERDLLEVRIFDEIEETVGTWLRAIIQRLEIEQTAIRRDQPKQPTPSQGTSTDIPLYQKRHPKSAKAACLTALDRRGDLLPGLKANKMSCISSGRHDAHDVADLKGGKRLMLSTIPFESERAD